MKRFSVFLLIFSLFLNSSLFSEVFADTQKIKFSEIAFSTYKNVIEYKGNVYYVNSNDSNKIYVYNPVDKTNKIAVNILSCNNLTLYKNSLFFTLNKSIITENDMVIYRYDIDKKELKLIKLKDLNLNNIDQIDVYSDYIYFRIENILYKININNYNDCIPQVINKNVSKYFNFIIYDGYLYCALPNQKFKSAQYIYSGESLYRIDLKSLKLEPVMANLSIDNFEIYNNKIYFCGNLDNQPNSDILGYYNPSTQKTVYKYITFKEYLPYIGNNNGFVFSDKYLYFWGKAVEKFNPDVHFTNKVYKLNLDLIDSDIKKIEKKDLEYVDIENEEISAPSTNKWAIKNYKKIISLKDNKLNKFNFTIDSKSYIVDITDKYIYYVDRLGQIVKSTLDGKEKYVIKQAKIISVKEHAANNRYIFINAYVGAMLSNQFVFKIDKQNDSVYIYEPELPRYNFVTIDDNIFTMPWIGEFDKHYAIGKIDVENFEHNTIVESGCDSLIHYYNNYIYYLDDKNDLYRIKVDGTDKNKLDTLSFINNDIDRALYIFFYKDTFYYLIASGDLYLITKNLEKNTKYTVSVMDQGTDILGIDDKNIYMNSFVAGLNGVSVNILLVYDKNTKKFKELDKLYGGYDIKPLKNISNTGIYIELPYNNLVELSK
ncbi:MAG: DUF5050 domain-containing protein [Caloramator sp.]|nr:DUF5050 domain-containing protein [Caloramator sp.]